MLDLVTLKIFITLIFLLHIIFLYNTRKNKVTLKIEPYDYGIHWWF
jgi:hypothetical protein